MNKSTYQQFVEQYNPVKNRVVSHESSFDGTLFETYGEEVQYVYSISNDHVWTLVVTESNEWLILPGFHYVNRLGYFISQEPWSDPNQEFIYN